MKKLVVAFERFGLFKVPEVLLALDRFAVVIPYVLIAAYAAANSEAEREALAVKPRGRPPRGWGLGRDLLRRWGLPEGYLPERRDVWVPGAWKQQTRGAVVHKAVQSAWRALTTAKDRYNRALFPYLRDHVAAQLAAGDAERQPDGRRVHDPDGEHWKRVAQAETARLEAERKYVRLEEAVDRAETAYKELVAVGRGDPSRGRWVLGLLPTGALSSFWTAATRDFVKLYEPHVAKVLEARAKVFATRRIVEPLNQGFTALTVARLTLATLAPIFHLETDYSALADRLRPPHTKV
jgi:hypothetical protein